MPLARLQFKPSIIKDETALSSRPFYTDGNRVRFHRGLPQPIGGWEYASPDTFLGKARGMHAWSSNAGVAHAAFGTHRKLYAYSGGRLYDITPIRSAATLGSGPLATTAGDATVTVTHTAHGCVDGDMVYLSGASAVGGITLGGGTGSVADPFTTVSGSGIVTVEQTAHGLSSGDIVTFSSVSSVGGILLGDRSGSLSGPFTTTNGSPYVTVAHSSHGLPTGQEVTFSGATAVGGITIDGTYQISVIDANSYQITHTADATSDATGGGTVGWAVARLYSITVVSPDIYQIEHGLPATSSATGGGTVSYAHFTAYEVTVVDADSYTVEAASAATSTATGGGSSVKAKYEINVGLEDGEGGGGYGVGGYGSGGYGGGNPEENSYPRTWSLDNWGEFLAANPRGGTIYEWDLISSNRARAITNAPDQVTCIVVTPERIMVALGCEDGGVFQPLLVRWSDQEDNTVWSSDTTNLAGFFPLSGGSRIVGVKTSSAQTLIWTDEALHAMRFVGDATLVYSFDMIGPKCGLIGPLAVGQRDGRAFWVGPDRQFYVYEGGAPQTLDCPCRNWMFDQLFAAQEEKIHVGLNGEFNEVWFFFPGGSFEVNRYVSLNWQAGSWAIGELDRTAWVDRSANGNPLACGTDGRVYFHETGTSANSEPMGEYLVTSPFEIGDGNDHMDVFGLIPDFKDLSVGVRVTVRTRQHPQADYETTGSMTVLPTTDRLDFRAEGRQASLRFDGIGDASAFWRAGDVRLDIQPAGKRR